MSHQIAMSWGVFCACLCQQFIPHCNLWWMLAGCLAYDAVKYVFQLISEK